GIHTTVDRTAGGGVAANAPGPVWAAGRIRRLRAVRSRARIGRHVSESVPADSVRAESVCAESVPADSVRAESVCAESVPADSVPAQPVCAEAAAAHPAPRRLSPPSRRPPTGPPDPPAARAAADAA